MSNRSRADEVASGAPYVVQTVNDRTPADLEDFVGDAVVTMTVERSDQVVRIMGSARLDGDTVVVYEKDADGIGKDVRTWSVRRQGDRFEAALRAAF